MKLNKLSKIVPAVIFVVLAVGLIAGISFGTLSGFGWGEISALCPLGAITTMVSTKTFLPRPFIALVIMLVLVFFLGRAFCGWMCPVPVLKRVGRFFKSARTRKAEDQAKADLDRDIAKYVLSHGKECKSCGSCKQVRKKLDSRHYVLGGALLSTVIFGFPVFCLFCPIGLSFATVLLVWRLFAVGDVTISVLLIPAVLIVELVVLRKWCTRICPLAALMNLVGRFGKSTRPVIDDSKCIETTTGKPCSRCATACVHDINLRHPDFAERTVADCTRCHACVEACPTQAIHMPVIVRRKRADGTDEAAFDFSSASAPKMASGE